MSPLRSATRDLELALLARHRFVIGVDEVGRGALAGPVSVGVCIVDRECGDVPEGLTDSKLLLAARREAMVEQVAAWSCARAVGHASPAEIDAHGIIAALRLAALRALAVAADTLGGEAACAAKSAIILDGSHNWLLPEPDLFSSDETIWHDAHLTVQVKADRDCAVVAAASVIAKVERDRIMSELADPGYGFAAHKGYACAAHREAIARLGASDEHRRSWRLLPEQADATVPPMANTSA
ncbi:hypothetical protein BSZ39_10375 [Bowdeniella nasicola]|uniref:Ribonuclease n=1 Tax=Bowdeniella nasicola TaxID=208480 RepID=A0A1Q5Q083_9ACTO|nr:ribonuclease HII [Bowdeniella nasicola]OKL53283.1 hypothetical protein BSZ39_10375 [Bowdeniella nasicola]